MLKIYLTDTKQCRNNARVRGIAMMSCFTPTERLLQSSKGEMIHSPKSVFPNRGYVYP